MTLTMFFVLSVVILGEVEHVKKDLNNLEI